MLGMVAYFDNGTFNPTFNPLDNDYFELVAVYWDTDKSIKEGKAWLHLHEGPKLGLCGKEKVTEIFGEGEAYYR